MSLFPPRASRFTTFIEDSPQGNPACRLREVSNFGDPAKYTRSKMGSLEPETRHEGSARACISPESPKLETTRTLSCLRPY